MKRNFKILEKIVDKGVNRLETEELLTLEDYTQKFERHKRNTETMLSDFSEYMTIRPNTTLYGILLQTHMGTIIDETRKDKNHLYHGCLDIEYNISGPVKEKEHFIEGKIEMKIDEHVKNIVSIYTDITKKIMYHVTELQVEQAGLQSMAMFIESEDGFQWDNLRVYNYDLIERIESNIGLRNQQKMLIYDDRDKINDLMSTIQIAKNGWSI